MLDKIIFSIVFVLFGIVTLFTFDFIRIAFGNNVYDNALLIALGAMMFVMNGLLIALFKISR